MGSYFVGDKATFGAKAFIMLLFKTPLGGLPLRVWGYSNIKLIISATQAGFSLPSSSNISVTVDFTPLGC